MRREISSRSTIIHKIVTPFIVVVFSIVTLVFVARAPGMSAYGVLLVGLASALFCFPLIWFATKLEHVSIDKTYLYIPRGGEEETIPLEKHLNSRANKLDQTLPDKDRASRIFRWARFDLLHPGFTGFRRSKKARNC